VLPLPEIELRPSSPSLYQLKRQTTEKAKLVCIVFVSILTERERE
jgi:hypothetical protein